MKLPPLPPRTLEWLSFIAAIVIGPSFLFLGYKTNLIYAGAAFAYFAVCATIVPALVYFGGRFKFIVWQVSVFSLVISILVDDFREGAIVGWREVASVGYGFWVMATILSLPMPAYFILKPMDRRHRVIYLWVIVAACAALIGVPALIVR